MSDPKTLLPPPPSPLATDTLDLGTLRGRLLFLVIVVLVGVAAFTLRARVPQIAIALPLAATALLPIFATGTRAQLAPTPIDLAARMLRPARDALASMIDLSHVELGTIGRVTDPRTGLVDEVRLACAPRDRTPGLRSIELALATCPGGRGAMPEIFVRFDDGSPAAERIASHIAVGVPIVCGRTPETRVVRLDPAEPTPRAAAALMARLLLSLEGRRATDRASLETSPSVARWRGPERRTLRAMRAMLAVQAVQPVRAG